MLKQKCLGVDSHNGREETETSFLLRIDLQVEHGSMQWKGES